MAPRAQRQRVATGKTSDGPAAKGTIPDADREIVQELQARWDYAKQQKDPIVARGHRSLRYLTDSSWDDADKRARKGRLTLHFDQLNQYRNLLVNSIRQQKRGIKVDPEGNGANDKTATVRGDRIRQIEYLSHAQEHYTTAFEGACDRSYGYVRIVAEWEPKGFKKRLRIKGVPNPDQVLEDPDAQSIVGADWKYLFYDYDMSREEFNRDYPDATFKHFSDLSAAAQLSAKDWQRVDRVRVAEYWTVTTETATLVRIGAEPGSAQPYTDVFEDQRSDAQKLQPVLQQREAERPVVSWYLTNGVELLAKAGKPKKNEWKGSRIPFKACYGRIVYKSNDASTIGASTQPAQKLLLSYVDGALDAQKYYDYLKSSEGERFKMNLLVPYRAHQGSMTPEQLLAYQDSVSSPVAVVFSEPFLDKDPNTPLLPLPEREIAALDVQGYEIAAEGARRDISNALGRSSIGDPRRGNARVDSGVGLQELAKTGDQSSYHFIDAYDAMVTAIGEDLDELLQYYDDTADTISTRTAGGDVKFPRVNDPNAVDEQGQPAPIMMDQGTHVVTISTGPSFDSQREEASAFADTLIGNQAIDRILGPDGARKILGLAIKLKNIGPLGDEMAEIADPQQQNDPKQMQQHLQIAMDQLKKQGAVLEEMHGIIQGKTLELQQKKYDTDEANKTKIEVAKIQFAATTTAADIKANLALTQQSMETQFQTMQGLMDAHQAQLDRVQAAQSQIATQQAAATSQASAQGAAAQSQDSSQQHAATMQQTPPPVDPNAAPAASEGAQ